MKHHLQKILVQGINQIFPFHGREMEKKWTQWQTLFSLTPKSLRTVTATMKLKDICSLEGKLWQASVQSLSCVWLFATPWTAAHQASLSIINSQRLLRLMFTESVMPSHPLLSSSHAFNLSQNQGLFQGVSSSHQVAKALEPQLQHQSFWLAGEFFITSLL